MRNAIINNPGSISLFKAILTLGTLDEAKRFFRDLLTPEEIAEFSKRWQAAQMLAQKVPYSFIVKKTKLSSTTVARVSRWLTRGMGGYSLILNRMASTHHALSSFEKGL